MGTNTDTSSNLSNAYAIIPARCGSKGVVGKNTKVLGGHPLIAYSIAAAKAAKEIDRVIVSTDSEEIAEIARDYGAEVPFLRPAKFAEDNAPDRDFLVHAIEWFQSHERTIPHYWVHLRPTTPLRDPALIDDAIRNISKHSHYSSLRSAHEAGESPFKWFMMNSRREFIPFRSLTGEDYSVMPRQMCPKVYIPNGYVDVLRTKVIMTEESIHGDNIFGYLTPFCREVDSPEDFELLEFELKRKAFTLLESELSHK
ncbi:MAG: acylneuraminate cytidylyltransferase family protein [Victivallaceae bacterium]|nr:acylneuraminate cytidylyltransferase family protein [Victivallaceae bacterium]